MTLMSQGQSGATLVGISYELIDKQQNSLQLYAHNYTFCPTINCGIKKLTLI